MFPRNCWHGDRLPSFPRSAWECPPGRSASTPAVPTTRTTRSVEDGIPTRSVGTRRSGRPVEIGEESQKNRKVARQSLVGPLLNDEHLRRSEKDTTSDPHSPG